MLCCVLLEVVQQSLKGFLIAGVAFPGVLST